MKRKLLSLFLALLAALQFCSVLGYAASATFSLSAAGSVTVGNQVRVSLSLKGSEKIGSWRFSLSYDPAYLEYVSGADSGGGGAVLFSDSSDGVSSLSKSVVFKTKKIGSATVSVAGGAQVVSFDSATNMSVNTPSVKINIVAAPTLSGENNLSSLSVSTGELTPAFSEKTTSYTMTVPFEIASIAVSATAKHNAASVSVTPTDALAVGENVIQIVVTAQNGSTKTYTITLTRQESELAGVTTEVNGTLYSVAYDPAYLQVPEGFTPSTALLGDKKILVYQSPQNSISIACLFTDDETVWYVFSEENQTFTKFQSLQGPANSLVVLTPDEGVKAPSGFLPDTVTIGEETYSVYSAKGAQDQKIYLVYGMSKDGTLGFYYYDSALGTFTSYFELSSAGKDAESTAKEVSALSSLLKDSEKKADRMVIVALSVGIAAVLLLIGLVISLVKKKKTKEEDLEEGTSFDDALFGNKKAQGASLAKEEGSGKGAGNSPETSAPQKKVRRKAKRTLDTSAASGQSSHLLMDEPPVTMEEQNVNSENKE